MKITQDLRSDLSFRAQGTSASRTSETSNRWTLHQIKSAAQIAFNSLHHALIMGEIDDGASLRQEEIAKGLTGRGFRIGRLP